MPTCAVLAVPQGVDGISLRQPTNHSPRCAGWMPVKQLRASRDNRKFRRIGVGGAVFLRRRGVMLVKSAQRKSSRCRDDCSGNDTRRSFFRVYDDRGSSFASTTSSQTPERVMANTETKLSRQPVANQPIDTTASASSCMPRQCELRRSR